jgi:nitrogen fixation protein NifU and related proteins
MGSPYSQTLLDHARKPRNRTALPTATVSQEATNPLCGDRVRVQLEIDGERVIDARFTANACAICVASASMMTELVRGQSLEDVEIMSTGRLITALEADIPKARVQCVALPVTVMQAALGRHRSAH